jgi:hypothetical protein
MTEALISQAPRPIAVAILLYGTGGGGRDAFTEEKYRVLAEQMVRAGIAVKTLAYHAAREEAVRAEALACDAVLVWINPTEPELDRAALDAFLRGLAKSGVLVSTHPDTILKIGTKDVLVETQAMDWSVEACAYRSGAEFRTQFAGRVRSQGSRVLKQHRGHSGEGVWKVSPGLQGEFLVQSAKRGAPIEPMTETALQAFFEREVFGHGSHLVDQAWVAALDRGMVRAYLCGTKVVGFGFQEINALYPVTPADDFTRRTPSRRHYYTEKCILFQELRRRLESSWVPALLNHFAMTSHNLPLLWDADFFLGEPERPYLLCEINVSCVSPFPESAITPLIEELQRRLNAGLRDFRRK